MLIDVWVVKKICLMFLLLFCMAGCKNQSPPLGVVAEVNGEPIYLHSLQTLMDSRMPSLGIPAKPSLEVMRKNYADALSTLIAHALVRQELERRGINPPADELDSAVKDVEEDFGEENLNEFLADASMRKDDWKQLVRDYLALETFRNQILLPRIKIGLPEIREYYKTHEKDFKLPATVRVCYFSGESEAELKDLCDLLPDKLPEQLEASQCFESAANQIPDPWKNELKNMQLNTCGKYVHEVGEWRSMALLRRGKERMVELSEAYALIEHILAQQKQEEAFEQWLAEKAQASHIRVAPELNISLAVAAMDNDAGMSGNDAPNME